LSVIGAVLTVVLLAAGGLASGAQGAQAIKLGVVDVQQVLNQSQRGMAIRAKLDQERATRQKELDAKQQELVKLQQDLEKQASVLSEQAKRDKREALERRVRDARRLAEDANRELEKRIREAEVEVTREIFSVIQEFGRDQGYTVVLERSNIVFSAQTVDVTPDVIKRFDAKAK